MNVHLIAEERRCWMWRCLDCGTFNRLNTEPTGEIETCDCGRQATVYSPAAP